MITPSIGSKTVNYMRKEQYVKRSAIWDAIMVEHFEWKDRKKIINNYCHKNIIGL